MPPIDTLPLRLRADPARVVVRPFHLAWTSSGPHQSRAARLVANVLALDDVETERQLALVLKDFEARHWQTRRIFMSRYAEIAAATKLDDSGFTEATKQLIGAYFCHEYSYAAAALMNPSATMHPDQSGMAKGACRIVMSLRAVGEGHISTIAFREGIVTSNGELELAPESPFATAADTCVDGDCPHDGPIRIFRHADSTLSATVIFPMTSAQANGLEDLRLVRMAHDDGSFEWIGTYTAYNGKEIRSEMLRTSDFREIDLVPLSGPAARNKGMALFPRKVAGQYMMIGRQDGENLFLLKSDSLTHWDDGEMILKPVYPWELVQIGNCGSPIELDEGWLLLTHGVGAMRKYAIGAVLLDKSDPSKVLRRTVEPILAAADDDREGYVPNVVYTCGAMRHGNLLFLPYGVSDSAVAFAFVPIADILASMTPNQPI